MEIFVLIRSHKTLFSPENVDKIARRNSTNQGVSVESPCTNVTDNSKIII